MQRSAAPPAASSSSASPASANAPWTFASESIYDRLFDYYEEQNRFAIEDYEEVNRLLPAWAAYFDGHNSKQHSQGDLRLKKLRYLLDHAFDHLGWERTDAQVEFHDAFTEAVLPKIYGDEWESQSARVLSQFGITELKQLVLCITPRRFGKSTGVGCFVACLIAVLPGIIAATFSTGKRASGLLMDNCRKVLWGLDDGSVKSRIVKDSAEQLVVAPEGSTGTSREINTQSESAKSLTADPRASAFHSYPSNPDGETQSSDTPPCCCCCSSMGVGGFGCACAASVCTCSVLEASFSNTLRQFSLNKCDFRPPVV